MDMLITGGNRGIGLAIAEEAVRQGQTVTATFRDRHPDIAAIRWEKLDVTDPEDQARLSQRIGPAPLPLLVCNAGVYLEEGQSPETGYAANLWAQTFAVNVTGVFLTIQALMPQLRVARGKIAIISSQMASTTRAPGGSYIYRASKAAVLNLGRNLAADLRGDGIAVGIYHPGWVQTDMGGEEADITPAAAAEGMMARFAALDMARTGCFETWDGRAHPI